MARSSPNALRFCGRNPTFPRCFPSRRGKQERGRSYVRAEGRGVGRRFPKKKPSRAKGRPRSGPSVLDRYLATQLLVPFAVGLAAFCALGVSIGVGSELTAAFRKGAAGSLGVKRAFAAAASIVALRIPHYLALALPMAALLAPLLAFARLGSDSELVAMRAAGISTARLMVPALLLFVASTGLHLLIGEGVAPHANSRAATRLQALSSTTQQAPVRRVSVDAVIYPEFSASSGKTNRLERLFFAKGFDGEKMHGVTLLEMEGRARSKGPGEGVTGSGAYEDVDRSRQQSALDATSSREASTGQGLRPKTITQAKLAWWDERLGCWVFGEGAQYTVGIEQVMKRDSASGPPPWVESWVLPEGQGSRKEAVMRTVDQYTIMSIRRFQREEVRSLARVPLDLAKAQRGRNFDDMTVAEVSALQRLMEASRNVKESRRYQVKLQQRWALPFAGAIFGTLGSLISLQLRKGQQKVALAMAFATMFCYYALSVTGSLLGQLGGLPPVLGAWLPNLVGLFVAAYLLVTSLAAEL